MPAPHLLIAYPHTDIVKWGSYYMLNAIQLCASRVMTIPFFYAFSFQ